MMIQECRTEGGDLVFNTRPSYPNMHTSLKAGFLLNVQTSEVVREGGVAQFNVIVSIHGPSSKAH